jgi:hypothetical protein
MWEQELSVNTFRMNGWVSPLLCAVVRLVITERKRGRNTTLTSNHVCYLDDGIGVGLREDTFSSSALDIETKDPQRCNLLPVSLRKMRNECVPPLEATLTSEIECNEICIAAPHIELDLTCRPRCSLREKLVLASRYLNPVHSDHLQTVKRLIRCLRQKTDLGINHKPEYIRNITLKGGVRLSQGEEISERNLTPFEQA